jgi:general secretion pathway protein L
MNTWLYLTPEGLPHASIDWPACFWSATGQRQFMPLSQAAQALSGRAIDLLLPMELCSWVSTAPWPSRRQPGAQAIAYAVEDQLADALENVHLGIGARGKDGCYPVMVIDRARFAAVLQLLAEAGIKVRSVYVDADVLPGDEPIAVRWFGRWLVGGGMPARVALSDDAISLHKPLLPADTRWLDERPDAVAIDPCLAMRRSHAINLLQGDFAARTHRLPWRSSGSVLLVLLLLTWGASVMRIDFLEGEISRLHGQNEQRFRALYPDQTRIVDLAAQLKGLQSQAVEPQRTRIVGLVSLIEHIIGASHVDVRRIEFRAGDGWKIQLSSNSFAELEQLRERGRQQGMPIRLESASKERDRVHATLTMEDNT